MTDSVDEAVEQFQLTFSNLPSSLATAGDPSSVCINIEDATRKFALTDRHKAQYKPQIHDFNTYRASSKLGVPGSRRHRGQQCTSMLRK